MGRNQNPWENDAGILSYASRTRARLVQCERALAVANTAPDADLAARLDDAWTTQFYAESSDPLGWAPPAEEVSFGIAACDQVWMSTAAIAQQLGLPFDEPCACAGAPGTPWLACSIRGGEGAISVLQETPDRQVIEAVFVARQPECGVRFEHELDALVYCPSGMESEPAAIPLAALRPEVIHAPLANGLIQVDPNLYVIKELRFVHVAARIVRAERALDFTVDGSPIGKEYRWRFRVFQGTLQEAVSLSNHLNEI
jgi:hypothetical protein